MPGHDLSEEQVKNGILFEKYKCHSCSLTLRDAVQPICGHWLCETCVVKLLTLESPTCPREDCSEPLKDEDGDDEPAYFPDNFVRREINNLDISCRWSQNGCKWNGKLKNYTEHLLQCMHAICECPKCGDTLPAGAEDHECPGGLSQCPLTAIGCDHSSLMKRERLIDHVRDAAPEHLKLIVEAITEIKSEMSNNSSRDSIQSVPRVVPDGSEDEDDPGYSTGKFPSSQIVSKGYPGLIPLGGPDVVKDGPGGFSGKKLKFSAILGRAAQDPSFLYGSSSVSDSIPEEVITKIISKVEVVFKSDLRRKDEEILALKSNQMKLEKTVKAKHAELEDRDFRLSLIENSNYDGTMVWKIPQFSQRMSDAHSGKYTSIFSLPFYTSRYGYKMCLRLYILGDGIGKGNYMSLFFVIMRGEFDNILQWPFTFKVTFRLINQSGSRDVIDTFQPETTSSSFRKPKSDMNIASGCPRFISHSDLKEKGFVVDDTIFIKCEVDTNSIRHP